MKRRYLRNSIETALEAILFAMLFFVASITEITIKFIPILLLILMLMVFIFVILKKYGRHNQ